MDQYQRLGPSANEALAILMAARDDLGITRVADITGLDRIGISVAQVTRPFSLSNAVSQGKGADMTGAAISALLEAAESFFAERIDRFELISAKARALDIAAERFAKHVRATAPVDWPDTKLAWIAAENLIDGSSAWVPLELVHTAYIWPPDRNDGVFWGTTMGLAAALHEVDAIVHGILECIERDAIARFQRAHGFLQLQRIDPASIKDLRVIDLLDRMAQKNLMVGLWLAPSPTGVPVILCHLMETNPRETALLHLPTEGSAAAFDPAAAIVHAVQEAVQARLAAISGARDDLTRATYHKYPDWQMIDAHRRLIHEGPGRIHWPDLPVLATATLPGLLADLERCGIDAVNLVRLDTSPFEHFSAVKIVMPQLFPLLGG
ncbi:YcaO-like family protein [Mesorhizobium helmanticense]|uniref:YcaO domain-containing protein n=1 Tax=Mesorhizobium helmanticense TaxID=1776423 RepID=A0A2T4J334_9HYPH|nr:YcaO-like family protein [Mesorhizobium helmanticense]PTE12273.1 hypothetical protein C9427_01400 [Mesorhizobium helmanticense]